MSTDPERTSLAGGCYVTSADRLTFTRRDNWEEAVVIDRRSGAAMLSLSFVRIGHGPSLVRSCPGSEVVLYCLRGDGRVDIGSHSFTVAPFTGAYVAAGEAFRIVNAAPRPLELLVCVCPQCDEPRWQYEMPAHFDAQYPQRVVAVSAAQREHTGDRYFCRLVDERVGSRQITQFVGSIPQSRAPEHFHLYEEAIGVLSGQGILWAGATSTPIVPGSLIFLPREAPHCVECTSDGGIELVGMFYPAGSPAVRYDTGA